MLKETIDNDLKEALKAKDQLRADTLRMLKTRVKNEEITAGRELDDNEIMPLVSSEIKRRRDSLEAYVAGGRSELAQKEQLELEILQKYLPEQLPEAEVRKVIDETLAGQEFAAKDFGKAMSLVMPKLKGKAEGSLISKILKEKLK